MALTITLDDIRPCPFFLTGQVDFDSSYPAGGESMDLSHYLGLVLGAIFEPKVGYEFEYDYTNKKVKARSGAGIEQFAYGDMKGSANTDSENADGGALPTNGAVVCAAETQTNIATALGVLVVAASPDVPRNVCFCVTNDSGGALNLYEGTTTLTVVGTYRGAAQTEDLTITSDAGNKEIANGKFRYVYGVKPFDTVTGVTQPNYATDAMAGGLKISVGLGSKLGLPGPIEATSDVIRLVKNAAVLATTGIVDATNETVNFGTLSDNDDVSILFRTSGEIAEATDLSGVTGVRFIAFGRPA